MSEMAVTRGFARRMLILSLGTVFRPLAGLKGTHFLLQKLVPHDRVDFAFERPFFGTVYRGNLKNYIDWWVFLARSYEEAILRLTAGITKTVRRKRGHLHIWDVGANRGHHALAMLAWCDSLEAFEPNKIYAATCRERLTNSGKSNWRLHELGLGLRNEILRYVVYEPTQTGTFSDRPSAVEQELPCVAADLFCKEGGLPDPDLIKIDTDGAEVSVLKGMKELLLRSRPWILLEWAPDLAPKNDEAPPDFYPGARLFLISQRRRQRPELSPLEGLPKSGVVELLIVPEEEVSLLPAILAYAKDCRVN